VRFNFDAILACEQALGGASAEQTFGAKRRAIARRFAPNVCSALAPPGACSQARTDITFIRPLAEQQMASLGSEH